MTDEPCEQVCYYCLGDGEYQIDLDIYERCQMCDGSGFIEVDCDDDESDDE